MKDGTCVKCNARITKAAALNHLRDCIPLNPPDTSRESFVLRINDRDVYRYWMYVKISGSATLLDLDSFLRDEWLECCGHLSMFDIDGIQYEDLAKLDEDIWGSTDTKIAVEKILYKGLSFKHVYDFRDRTTLGLTVVGKYQDDASAKKQVKLLVKNNPTRHRCKICKKDADLICRDCYEVSPSPSYFCKSCSEKHDQHELHPVANSPRMGTCEYG